MQHYISDSIYGLTLTWITSEKSTKQLECRHLDSIFFTVAGPSCHAASPLCSGVDCRLPLSVSRHQLRQLLFPTNSLFASRYHFRIRRDFRSKNPLSGFAPKQTKESSAWRATHIVLHLNTTRNNNNIIMKNFHEIYPYYHKGRATLKFHFYRKYLNDTNSIATIIISASITM